MVYMRSGRNEEARKALEECRDIALGALERSPENMRLKSSLARTCDLLGGLLSRPTTAEDAERAYRLALKLREEQYESASEPSERYIPVITNIASKLAQLLFVQRRFEEAHEVYEKIVELHGKFLERYPKRKGARTSMALFLMNVGMTLDNLGRTEEAVAAARRALAFDAENPSVLFRAACGLSTCSTRFTGEKARALADEAMECLGSAVKHGFKSARSLSRSRALDPLRKRDDFKELLRGLR
jgi:tetratricopeptide (TPR) repeat protein